jgi:hypothetical protein
VKVALQSAVASKAGRRSTIRHLALLSSPRTIGAYVNLSAATAARAAVQWTAGRVLTHLPSSKRPPLQSPENPDPHEVAANAAKASTGSARGIILSDVRTPRSIGTSEGIPDRQFR